jgi:hypothetical protein
MSSCTCGSDRRQFWLWRDSNGELHASRFAPTNGAVRSVYATTARDALWAASNGRQPKHNVHDVEDEGNYWEGRCGAATAQGMAAL